MDSSVLSWVELLLIPEHLCVTKLTLGAAGKVFCNRFVHPTSKERLPEKQNQAVLETSQFLSINM